MDKKRVAIVVSHPIQHFCPQYESFTLNGGVQLKVFFASAIGYKKYMDPNFKTEVVWDNLKLDKFDHIFLNGDKILPSNKYLDAPTVVTELAKFRPDVIIIYGYYQKVQRRTYRWAVKNNVCIAYISDSELRQKADPIKNFIRSLFVKRFFSKIDFFLSVGDSNEDFYIKNGVNSNKLLRMCFPIDINLYKECYANRQELHDNIRYSNGISNKEIVACVVGKLVSWKNQDHIIEAMLILEKQNIFLHLFILGSGIMIEKWKEKAKLLRQSKVIFTGFVNPRDLPSYYAASDFYIHPASVEPHSIAISEAIYMGCPIIASDRCGSYGPTDDIQEGKNGYVYKFGEILSLAEKIRFLIDNTHIKKEFGMYSHKIAENFQEASHKLVINKLKDLLLEKN